MNNLLEIRNLTKRYADFTLEDVNITVPAGSVVGFIGANGAGKTTTIKSALGIINHDAGSISLFGEQIDDQGSVKVSAAKQRIGVVLDACSFPDAMTIAQMGKTMSCAYERWSADSFTTYLDLFGLNPEKKIKELSRGMGMKLTLAGALSHDAELLILDEATAGLDPIARDEALDILRDFMADETHGILMSSHITSDLEKIADYIVCIDAGKIVFQCEKDTITDLAGIAQCRESDFNKIVESAYIAPEQLRFVRHAYGTSVLISDRFDFARHFSDIVIEKATIDEYMGLMLKGGPQ